MNWTKHTATKISITIISICTNMQQVSVSLLSFDVFVKLEFSENEDVIVNRETHSIVLNAADI
jgi:hypothetical protein